MLPPARPEGAHTSAQGRAPRARFTHTAFCSPWVNLLTSSRAKGQVRLLDRQVLSATLGRHRDETPYFATHSDRVTSTHYAGGSTGGHVGYAIRRRMARAPTIAWRIICSLPASYGRTLMLCCVRASSGRGRGIAHLACALTFACLTCANVCQSAHLSATHTRSLTSHGIARSDECYVV